MDKLSEFVCRRVNVLDMGDGLVLGREPANGMDYMTISKDGEVLFAWWSNPKKKASKTPKHTGGKPPYVKLMTDSLEKHSNLSLESYGFMVRLAGSIQWGTNLIINKRTKKPLNGEMMGKIAGVRKSKAYAIIKELTKEHLLTKDKDGYKISPDLLQKGGVKK